MFSRKEEILEELGIKFVAALEKGETFRVKADDRPHEDTVAFDHYTDGYITFCLEGERMGVFWEEVREGKVALMPLSPKR